MLNSQKRCSSGVQQKIPQTKMDNHLKSRKDNRVKYPWSIITLCSKFSSLKLFRNFRNCAKVYACPKSLEYKIIISQHLCLFVTKGIINFHPNHHKISLDGLIKDSTEDNNDASGQWALFGIAHNLSNL